MPCNHVFLIEHTGEMGKREREEEEDRSIAIIHPENGTICDRD